MWISQYLTKLTILLCDNSPLKKTSYVATAWSVRWKLLIGVSNDFQNTTRTRNTRNWSISLDHALQHCQPCRVHQDMSSSMEIGKTQHGLREPVLFWFGVSLPLSLRHGLLGCLHGFEGGHGTLVDGWSHQLGFIIFIHPRFAGHHTIHGVAYLLV